MKPSLVTALALASSLLVGCGASQSSPAAPSVEPAASSNSAPTATQPASEKSSRGNLIKVPGQGASVTDKEKTVATFVINSIQLDPACTSQYAQPSENGHFVALEVSMETMPELAESVNPQFGLAGYGWKAIAENGTTFNGDIFTAGAYMCLDDAEKFPSALGPAEKATGKIILDVPTATGVLVHKQGFMAAGWEWAYPAK